MSLERQTSASADEFFDCEEPEDVKMVNQSSEVINSASNGAKTIESLGLVPSPLEIIRQPTGHRSDDSIMSGYTDVSSIKIQGKTFNDFSAETPIVRSVEPKSAVKNKIAGEISPIVYVSRDEFADELIKDTFNIDSEELNQTLTSKMNVLVVNSASPSKIPNNTHSVAATSNIPTIDTNAASYSASSVAKQSDAIDDEVIVILVRNLNTGETVPASQIPLGNLPSVFGKNFKPDDQGHSDSTSPISAEEMKSKKESLGWFTKLFDRSRADSPRNCSENASSQVKSKLHSKNIQELSDLRLAQSLSVAHIGPIWTMKFSNDGSYLATAGQDSIVRVWLVLGSPAAIALNDKKNNIDEEDDDDVGVAFEAEKKQASAEVLPGCRLIVRSNPLRLYAGHKSDITDLSWSKSNFLVSSSMDKTVRLWHVSRPKCLKLFQHSDCVTSVAFHPTEERYFLSGSLDKKLRVWNIPENRVVDWAPTPQMITAVCFTPQGKMAVAGLYSGEVIFYQTDGLKYFTQVDCKNRHGKDSGGRKVTGLNFDQTGKKLLISTNDSRLRIYDMDDFSMKLKLKGNENTQLQIQASFSEDGKQIICGSEDSMTYIWNSVKPEEKSSFFNFSSKDETNQSYEYFKAHNSIVTAALLASKATIRYGVDNDKEAASISHLIVTASYEGEIKLFENRGMPKKV